MVRPGVNVRRTGVLRDRKGDRGDSLTPSSTGECWTNDEMSGNLVLATRLQRRLVCAGSKMMRSALILGLSVALAVGGRAEAVKPPLANSAGPFSSASTTAEQRERLLEHGSGLRRTGIIVTVV